MIEKIMTFNLFRTQNLDYAHRSENCMYLNLSAGADLGFSRGGGAEFQKIFENFDDLFFFRSIRLIFRALPKQ